MKSLTIRLGDRSYPIHIGEGLLRNVGQWMASLFSPARTAVVTHPLLHSLYGSEITDSLTNNGLIPSWIEVPEGEKTKSLEWAGFLYDRLVELKMERSSPIVAMGGGVVGDLSGFVAATYLRGIPFVQIPTTLLAQVDSSVGGKTGVNHRGGKNLIGAFHQPRLVLIDIRALQTLPTRELRAGLSEVVKYGVIWDEGLFQTIEAHLDEILALVPSRLEEIVGRSCAIKAMVVEKDEREADFRSILNFGHTIGHAIEATKQEIEVLHGEAVAIGMVAACKVSLKKGICSSQTLSRVRTLLDRIGLPTEFNHSVQGQNLIAAIELDKKSKDSIVKFVAVEKIGQARFIGLRPQEIVAAAMET